MGKDLKALDLGVGIYQRQDGFIDSHSDLSEGENMTVEAWFDYYLTGEWRIGPPKSKSGYRDIPITQECRRIPKKSETLR